MQTQLKPVRHAAATRTDPSRPHHRAGVCVRVRRHRADQQGACPLPCVSRSLRPSLTQQTATTWICTSILPSAALTEAQSTSSWRSRFHCSSSRSRASAPSRGSALGTSSSSPSSCSSCRRPSSSRCAAATAPRLIPPARRARSCLLRADAQASGLWSRDANVQNQQAARTRGLPTTPHRL